MHTPAVVAFLVSLVLQRVGGRLLNGTLSCIGSIFGTGTNGAYLEKVENITKLGDSPARKNGGYMVVNTEWGAFNNTVSLSILFPGSTLTRPLSEDSAAHNALR